MRCKFNQRFIQFFCLVMGVLRCAADVFSTPASTISISYWFSTRSWCTARNFISVSSATNSSASLQFGWEHNSTKGFLVVLAPLELNMSTKELQSLNSSHYCNTSFFVFLVKTSWKHCQPGTMARFQFDLRASARFNGTCILFPEMVAFFKQNSKQTVLNI